MKNGSSCSHHFYSINSSVFFFFREIFERTKTKYLDHIKNVQNDLHETRQLLEKDTELKLNQESAYQQLIDERRQLLTRYKPLPLDIDISAHTSSPTVDDLHTHPHLISNITFYRQVFFALYGFHAHLVTKHLYRSTIDYASSYFLFFAFKMLNTSECVSSSSFCFKTNIWRDFKLFEDIEFLSSSQYG